MSIRLSFFRFAMSMISITRALPGIPCYTIPDAVPHLSDSATFPVLPLSPQNRNQSNGRFPLFWFSDSQRSDPLSAVSSHKHCITVIVFLPDGRDRDEATGKRGTVTVFIPEFFTDNGDRPSHFLIEWGNSPDPDGSRTYPSSFSSWSNQGAFWITFSPSSTLL